MKVFSSYDDYGYEDERLYSVLLDEEELYLFSEYQKEYSKLGKLITQKAKTPVNVGIFKNNANAIKPNQNFKNLLTKAKAKPVNVGIFENNAMKQKQDFKDLLTKAKAKPVNVGIFNKTTI